MMNILMLGKTEGRRRGDGRGRGCWMASPTQWTWVWISFRSWWWTGRPGVLQSTGSQRVRHDWATELNWLTDKHQDMNWWENWSSKVKEQLFLSFKFKYQVTIRGKKLAGYLKGNDTNESPQKKSRTPEQVNTLGDKF